MGKAQQRQIFIQKRAAILPEQAQSWSKAIVDDLLHRLGGKNFSGTLFLYSALSGEPDLLAFIKESGLRIALPRVASKHEIQFHLWRSGDALVCSRFGIMEPQAASPVVEPTSGDIAVVPALAIDRRGYRLGFGRGYYDRWLGRSRTSLKLIIGVVFPPCFSDANLPVEPHDIPVDLCLTGNQSVEFSDT